MTRCAFSCYSQGTVEPTLGPAPDDSVTSSIRLTRQQREWIGQLVEIAYQLRVIEKPTFGDLVQRGLAFVKEECNLRYRQIRDKGGR